MILFILLLSFSGPILANSFLDLAVEEILSKGVGLRPVDGAIEFNLGEEFTKDKVLGYRPIPNKVNRQFLYRDGKVIYDYKFRNDSFGRRVSDRFQSKKGDEFILLFGCSFVFGLGVEEDETVSYFLNDILPKQKAYNYGVGGSGPNQMLAKIRSKNLGLEVIEKRGTLLYFYIKPHIGRVNGFMQELQWYRTTPYFRKRGESLEQAGSIEKAQPLRTSFFNFLRDKLGLGKIGNLPPLMESHYLYLCDIVSESKRSFLEQYPDSRFVLVQHPLIGEEMNPSLRLCLEERKIKVVSLMYEDESEKYGIVGDGHPNGVLNKKLATDLSEILFKSKEISEE